MKTTESFTVRVNGEEVFSTSEFVQMQERVCREILRVGIERVSWASVITSPSGKVEIPGQMPTMDQVQQTI